MKRPFKDLRETAVNVADAISCSLDESYSISNEQYMFERYEWTFTQLGVDNGKVFTLSISGDDIDQHFRDAP